MVSFSHTELAGGGRYLCPGGGPAAPRRGPQVRLRRSPRHGGRRVPDAERLAGLPDFWTVTRHGNVYALTRSWARPGENPHKLEWQTAVHKLEVDVGERLVREVMQKREGGREFDASPSRAHALAVRPGPLADWQEALRRVEQSSRSLVHSQHAHELARFVSLCTGLVISACRQQ